MALPNKTRRNQIFTAVSDYAQETHAGHVRSCAYVFRLILKPCRHLIPPAAVLEVSRDASEADIKKAFRKLSIKHHPDKGGDKVLFQKIQRAYEVLSNEELRMVYDHAG